MKAVCYVKPGTVEVMDMPEPQLIHPEDVLVRVSYCAVCGDDKRTVRAAISGTVQPPYIIGHEMSGTVVALSDANKGSHLAVGDRVTGNFSLYCGKCYYCKNGMEHYCENSLFRTNAMAEYIVWREKQLYKIPDNVGTLEACLTEPLSACLRGIEEANIRPGSHVAIFGAGGIGLMLLQLAKKRGAGYVTIIEPSEKKRQLAMKIGADFTVDPYNENVYKRAALITGARGYDSVIEASSHSEAVKPAFEVLGRGGTLVIFSIHDIEYSYPLNLTEFYWKDAVIRSIFTGPHMFSAALNMMHSLDLSHLTTNVIPYTRAAEAFDAESTKDIPKFIISL